VCERWPMCVLPFLGTKAFKAEHWRLSLLARFDKEIRVPLVSIDPVRTSARIERIYK